MNLSSRDRLALSMRRLPAMAVVLALVVVSVPQGFGSVVSAQADRELSHDEVCGCGPKCRGASCCCGPRRAKLPPPTPVEEHRDETPVSSTPGLCMGATPCGDSGLPVGNASVESISRISALCVQATVLPALTARYFTVAESLFAPSPHLSLPSEPPEGSTLV